MLNLSDKELDRFSKEAAQEYEPGDVLGERAWERLEVHLDRDLGRVSRSPLRHIRRFPFYYAPALLVLLGVSYYMMRRSSGGSPPLSAVKAPAAVVQHPLSSQPPVYTQKSTPTSSAAASSASSSEGGGDAAGAGSAAGSAGAGLGSASTSGSALGSGPASGSTGNAVARNAGAGIGGATGTKAGNRAHAAESGENTANATNGMAGRTRFPTGGMARTNYHRPRRGNNAANRQESKTDDDQTMVASTMRTVQPRELTRTSLQGLRPTKKAPFVNDSALRAFTLKSTPPTPIRKSGLHINRSLTFGVVVAPDFASVNSLAGDRPGSTIGLTADYQFANHLYIGTGLLLDRKIFSARSHDFHAPAGFYQSNGLRNINTIKGSFEMLEIPLNLRYDFSVTGSTLFFINSGLSSYLLTSENNNYYSYNPMTRQEMCMPVSSPNKSYLFSALNFSLGVETGLSNSLSLLIAPYMKVPLRGVGIGQMQMNTVGINFSLRFAPVISRKRY